MNKYESVIILKGTLTEDECKLALNEIIEKVRKFINIEKIDEVGLKKLAYEVKEQKAGYYIVVYYKANSQDILEVERYYRINDNIIKFLTVKKDD